MSETRIALSPDQFARHWSESLSTVFAQTSGNHCPFVMADAVVAPPMPERLMFDVTLRGALTGTVTIALSKQSAVMLSQKLMGEEVVPSAPCTSDVEDAILEIVSQAAGAVATELREQYGEISSGVQRKQEASEIEVTFLLKPEQDLPVVIAFFVGKALLGGSSSSDGGRDPRSASHRSPKDSAGIEPNIGLIMDVKLNVALRFGKRQLPLSDVIELAAGSVIELDRQVDEPVELILGNRVIARGEVVIVDGDYGLRVTEVLQEINQDAL
jgi:flagellar motor switch protein FliN/FliY